MAGGGGTGDPGDASGSEPGANEPTDSVADEILPRPNEPTDSVADEILPRSDEPPEPEPELTEPRRLLADLRDRQVILEPEEMRQLHAKARQIAESRAYAEYHPDDLPVPEGYYEEGHDWGRLQGYLEGRMAEVGIDPIPRPEPEPYRVDLGDGISLVATEPEPTDAEREPTEPPEPEPTADHTGPSEMPPPGPADDDDGSGSMLRWLAASLGLLLAVLVIIFLTLRDGGGGGTAHQASAGSQASGESSPSSGQSAPSTTTGDPTLDTLFAALGLEPNLDDPLVRQYVDDAKDFIDSISSNVPAPAYSRPEIDVASGFATRPSFGGDVVGSIFNHSTVPCGRQKPFHVACAGVPVMPAGEVLMLGMKMHGAIPLQSPDRSYIYSAVFDSDGDPANNWQPHPPFDWDLFQGTDRWYQLTWDHNQKIWYLSASQLDATGTIDRTTPTAARAVVAGDAVVFLIPASEVAGSGAFRLTAFAHDGAYAEGKRAADVLGGNPTEPLKGPPTDVVEAHAPTGSG